ncbi:MAG: hypothetical protein JO118_00530 [Acetobacteraceae bacterium]|nr:hypothetical protein [Acetobacteraceae bacterium]
MASWRSGLPAACILLALCGCEKTIDTNTGETRAVTVTLPGALPRTLGEASPPPPSGPVELPPSGLYAGQGRSLNNPGGRCRPTIAVRDWRVDGNSVRFGRFAGRIQPDGTLRMHAGEQVIVGRFDGPRFTGRSSAPPPACRYALTVEPIG